MLTERQRKILKAIIDLYIPTAEPIGSKVLAETLQMGVSSATLRNEMAELLNQGYLEQPHTSAGRVPSSKGYRLYVDELMNGYALTREDLRELRAALQLSAGPEGQRVTSMGHAISALTQCAVITTKPSLTSPGAIRRVEIVRLGGAVHVLVLVMDTGLVCSKTVEFSSIPDSDSLSRLSGAINLALAGVEPDCVGESHIGKLNTAAGTAYSELPGHIVSLLHEVLPGREAPEIHLSGTGNLLAYPEFRDADKAQALLKCLSAAGRDWLPKESKKPVEIRIGGENREDALREASVMITGYSLLGGYRGYIGIVGPMRMPYSRLAARLEYFARSLSAPAQERAKGYGG